MATQVQIRGAAQATQEARTLVSRELDVNTTDNRISIHNGSFSGGIRHVNMYDQQNNEFNCLFICLSLVLSGKIN